MATNITSYQPPAGSSQATQITSQVNDQAQGRLNAASPYMMSPYRAMDYLSGYTAPSSTVPTAPGSTGAMGSAMAPSTGLSGNNFTGGSGTTASAAQPQVASSSAYNTPMAGTPGLQGQNWWNQPMTPQAMAGMGQNVQSSLSGLSQLLGKGGANPSPQNTQTAGTPQNTQTAGTPGKNKGGANPFPQNTQTAGTPNTTQKASA